MNPYLPFLLHFLGSVAQALVLERLSATAKRVVLALSLSLLGALVVWHVPRFEDMLERCDSAHADIAPAIDSDALKGSDIEARFAKLEDKTMEMHAISSSSEGRIHRLLRDPQRRCVAFRLLIEYLALSCEVKRALRRAESMTSYKRTADRQELIIPPIAVPAPVVVSNRCRDTQTSASARIVC
ncbi:uncharacterized protein SCHCODRAFT_02664068 [Schizophyllum commune H4-8]|uniref:Uncharacterized protein n=1 Tax=Schizophyllum commune (strain H4-8 / FGSC 9210) TaxID=578458 RepID=D8PZ54_SCHCM|nr:uncharacterized protein SCHCODRAFT_02664068 [Schizophyllum commune H4-8]KAI5896229.1 hypothetical protein SCHCODRAFT_02664068 [Schizophyllum commune H4-8]